MTERFAIGTKKKPDGFFLRTTQLPGEWFCSPCPINQLICMCDGIKFIRTKMDGERKERTYWSWSGIKKAGVLKPDLVAGVDAKLRELEGKFGATISEVETP